MQHLARASLGSTVLRVGLASCALAAAATGIGCRQDGPLTDDEMTQLRQFMLPAGPPPDMSNAYSDNPDAIKLGQQLFFDTRYAGALLAPYNSAKGVNGALGAASQNHLIGCVSCHDPADAGADRRSQPNATSLGAAYTLRNAPTVINAAYAPVWQFWDGRADSLWSQALSPPEGLKECDSSRLEVAHFLYDRYQPQFEEVFGAGALADVARLPTKGKPGDADYENLPAADKDTVNRIYANFGKAIAAYERQLVSNNFAPSPFDRFMAGERDAMEPAAVRGARLFIGHAGCTECHRGPMFTDDSFHNIGIPQTGEYVPAMDEGRYDGIVALTATGAAIVTFDRGSEYSDDKDDRYRVALGTTAPDSAIGQFKTPTLRNVSKTAPYMHDGVYQTLWDVVNHYNFGGATGTYAGDKDPAIAPLMLTDADLSDLVEFLEALSDGDALDSKLVTAPALPMPNEP